MTDDQQHALQEQRTREAMAVEIAALREHEARAKWCEESKAAVGWSYPERLWLVVWIVGGAGYISRAPSRDAAIDKARGK